MGQRGPLPKGDGRQRTPSAVVVARRTGEPVEVPEAPDGLLPVTVQLWQEYFASELAEVIAEVDFPALRRLFTYYDQWERAKERLEDVDDPVAAGSTGQPKMHPLFKELRDLESVIEALEGKLGVTPMARARLGIEIGQQALTWDEVNRRARERKKGDGDAGSDASPGAQSGVIQLS